MPLVRFDPRTKLMLLLGVNVMLFLNHSLLYEGLLLVFCCASIGVSGDVRRAVKFLVLYIVMLALGFFVVPYLSRYVYTLASFFVVLLRKFLPLLMLGQWILSGTQVGEFVAAMWRLRLPQSAIIPISVVFRYFPTVREEWNSIRSAMKMRGIGFSVEHLMAPLLISAVNISEELSAAALCRALDAPGQHTSIYKIGFKSADIMALCAAVVLLAAGIVVGVMSG